MSIVRLPWDSALFGLQVGRLERSTLGPGDGLEVRRQASAGGFDCLYLQVEGDDAATLAEAESGGFRVMDVRLTLSGPVAETAGTRAQPVRTHRPEDLPGLESLASEAHRNTRFFRDARFPAHAAAELYRRWIRKECSGGAEEVLVLEGPAGIDGYLSLRRSEHGAGEIGLFAVAERARGRGAGSSLLGAASAWLRMRGCRTLSVVTQGQSVPAQRLYQRHGLRTERVQLSLHLWPRAGPEER